MNAYQLQATDILVQSYEWRLGSDTRISGNPQIMVDLTALRDKIDAAGSQLRTFFNSTDTTLINSDFFEWSLEIETNSSESGWSASVWTVLWHIY